MVFSLFFEALYFGHFLSFYSMQLQPPKLCFIFSSSHRSPEVFSVSKHFFSSVFSPEKWVLFQCAILAKNNYTLCICPKMFLLEKNAIYAEKKVAQFTILS